MKLLDCWVLRVIDQLPAMDNTLLVEMEPKLREVYRRPESSWVEIVEAEMDFSAGVELGIVDLWKDAEETATSAGVELNPMLWAQAVVDQNFL